MGWLRDNTKTMGPNGDDQAREPFLLGWQATGVCLLVVCLLAGFWRTLGQIGLYVEDAVLFSAYYGNRLPLNDIFRSHIGQPYLTVPADFLAWLYAWADVRWQPWLYQTTGFVWAVGAAALLSFSGLIRSRALLLISPLLLGLAGLNHLYYYTTLIYIMYSGVIMLLILLLYPAPTTRKGLALQALLLLILPWSGPYSVLALPAAGLLFFCTGNRAKRALLLLAFCSSLAYVLTVTGSNLRLARLATSWVVERYFSAVFDKVILFDFFAAPHLGYGVFLVLALALAFFLLREDEGYLQTALVLLLWLFGSIAMFYLSAKFAQYIRLQDSHLVVAGFCWMVFLVLTVDRLLGKFWSGPRGAAVLSLALLVLVGLNLWMHAGRWQVRPSDELRRYLETVAFYQRQDLEEQKLSVWLWLPRARMAPMVQVGYPGPDGRQLRPNDPAIITGRRFVLVR